MGVDKKLILNIMVIIAISSSIIPLFITVFSFDVSDAYTEGNFEGYHWKTEDAYLLTHLIVFDEDNNEAYHKYRVFSGLEYEIGTRPEISNNWEEGIADEMDFPLFILIYNIIVNIVRYVFLIILSYFLYRSIKECCHKKSKNILYAGITSLIMNICFFAVNLYKINSLDTNNLGYLSFVKLEYGFYTIVLSIVLLFVAYFTQDYLIDFQKDLKTIDKNLKL